MADPKYVRLATHLVRGGRYDLASGWGISGYDVKEMPDAEDEPNAYRYVRGELAAGRIEGASKAEFEEAHPDIAKALGYKIASDDPSARPYQEREVQREAAKVHRKVKARRDAEDEVDAFEVDTARREATIKAQQAQADRGDARKSRSAAEAEDEANAATQVHLNREAEARRRGANVNTPVVDDDEDDDEGDEYDEMSKDALIEEAKRRKLPHSGSADKIRARLRDHDAAADGGDDDGDETDEGDDDEDDGTEGDNNQS